MTKTNGETARQDQASSQSNTAKVRSVIEQICTAASTPVNVEERAEQHRVQVTYVGERPMPYAQWFKLVDSIDAALDPLEMIDWESSELSQEAETERMAAWAILP